MSTRENILNLIGNTPMVKINEGMGVKDYNVYAKLEMFNPGGSVKDRIALSMIEGAEKEGALKPEGTIVEPTSGNTGIGLAIVAAVKGYRLILTMPESMSVERRNLLKRYGASLILTPADQGMSGAIQKAEEIVKEENNAFMPQQFSNQYNPEIHRKTTAREILKQGPERIDALVAGVGTGGSITGVGEILKDIYPSVKVFAVEPEQSATLSRGEKGPHRIQGIGAGFKPDTLNLEVVDHIIAVDDIKAYEVSEKLSQKEGLLVGISSGAAFLGVLESLKYLEKGSNIITIFPDTGERYLSTTPYYK